jgi:hypothetical protein
MVWRVRRHRSKSSTAEADNNMLEFFDEQGKAIME